MPLIPAEDPARHVWRMAASRPGGTSAALDAPARPPLAVSSPQLHGAIPVRRAHRRFTDQPVRRELLAEVLSGARAAYGHHWPPAQRPVLRVLVAAYEVTGLLPGLHDDDGHLGCPRWLRRLRSSYAKAPALVLVCADLASRRPGHAAALFHAAALGHAVWLSATALGLGACGFGGSSAEVTACAAGGTPSLRHAFTLALGHPESETCDRPGGGP
ncbi:nitroreductase family protein [Phytohabitans kaempferiae]|uniref:Nitroreductase family protein n=1 Tax=Phytohabitans kaempferiae TaxID=1620943 RepID=A0ABV6M513_9ACTN